MTTMTLNHRHQLQMAMLLGFLLGLALLALALQPGGPVGAAIRELSSVNWGNAAFANVNWGQGYWF